MLHVIVLLSGNMPLMNDIIKYKHSGKAPSALYVMCQCVSVYVYDPHSSGFQFQAVCVVRLVIDIRDKSRGHIKSLEIWLMLKR